MVYEKYQFDPSTTRRKYVIVTKCIGVRGKKEADAPQGALLLSPRYS